MKLEDNIIKFSFDRKMFLFPKLLLKKIKKNPEDFAMLRRNLNYYYNNNKTDEMGEFLKDVLEENFENINFWLIFYKFNIAISNQRGALQCIKKAMRLSPNDEELRILLLDLYYIENDYESIINNGKDSFDILAKYYISEENYKDAEKCIFEDYKLEANSKIFRGNLIQLLKKFNLEYINENFLAELEKYRKNFDAAIYFILALMCGQLGNLLKAKEYANIAKEMNYSASSINVLINLINELRER